MQYRPRSWLDPRIRVAPSPIDGLGLFAADAIQAGEVVAMIGGAVVTDAELERRASHSSAAIGGGLNLLQAPDDPLRYGNHSCDPNLWLLDAVTLAARHDIAPGEELTSDYATMTGSLGWQMTCSCRANLCRGVVRGTDWQRPELQRRYRGHFSPFLAERMAGSK